MKISKTDADINKKSAELEKIIEKGRLEEALDFIESLSQVERGNWRIQNLTGIVCACCGQYKEAKTFFNAALEQKPEDAVIQYNLADTCAALGERRRAADLLKHCQQNADAETAADIAALQSHLDGQKGGRVLMAAYYFPPLSGSGVFRSIKFAKYLPLFGWEPTVLSTDQPPKGWEFADESQLAEIPEDMEVVRIPDLISTGRNTSLSGEQVKALLDFLQNILRFSPEADKRYQQFTNTQEGILSLLTFPCAALSWAYETVQYIEENIDIEQFDVIYTTSGPSSAHLIGFYLRRKYGIPWVADFRDPWTFNAYGEPYNPADPEQRLLFELESILLRQADMNLTVVDQFIPMYQKEFGLPAEKILSISNGYDEDDFAELEVPQGRTDRFTINYSGLLYSKQRSIAPILSAIRQLANEGKIELSKIRFRHVGVDTTGGIEAAAKFGLAQIIENTDYCAHSQALQANLNADLLLLLVGDEPKFKPVPTGKFFEYLRSGRPILALAPKGGFVDCTLRETKHGKTFLGTQLSGIKSMILREYKRWERGERTLLLHSPGIDRFERRALTGQLAQVLEDVRHTTQKPLEISSEIYDDGYLSGGANGNYHKHYMQSFYYPAWRFAFSLLADVERSAAVLEIGCGAGQFANMLFDNGFTNYTGFDYSSEGVALALKNNPGHEDRFVTADAFQTELMVQKYDLIICFEVLEHVQQDLELLQRIQPGTRMLVSVPSFDDPYHVRYFSDEKEVQQRYQQVIKIADIHVFTLYESNRLFYIVGEKR